MANPDDLEPKISHIYREAYRDVSKKMADFTRRHMAKDRRMRRDLKSGKITQAQYAQWVRGQVFIGQQWSNAKASIDLTIKNAMNEANDLVYQKSIGVFVNSANYTAYQIEKDFDGGINFDLYDRKTVSRLILEDPELLPRKRDINGDKLEAWNTKTIANCVSQAIIQGESVDELSKRIARDTNIAAGRSSLLYARTAMTGAQNAGRVERMKEAEEMGIKVQKQWMASLDSRTRDSHAAMDGEIADTNSKFSNGLMYPGDPNGAPAEVYNCRCTLIYRYPEYSDYSKMERTAYIEPGDADYDPDNPHRQYETVKGMNYKQWVSYKQGRAARNEGSAELEVPATLRNLPQYTASYLSEHAGDMGLTVDQQNELKDMLRDMYDHSDTYSFVGSDAVLDIADGGHMKNYFERAGRQISASEEELRIKVSNTLFGVDVRGMDPTQYEKYGFMGSSDTTKMLTTSSADKYGDFCIKFNKDSINDRLTYTFGDSLINIDTGRTLIAGRMGSDTNIAGISLDRMSSSYKRIKSLQKSGNLDASSVATKCISKTGYVEAQVHGMVTKNDISEVWVKHRWNGRQWEQWSDSYDLGVIEQKLKDNGIKMYRYGITMVQDPNTKDWVERVVIVE